MKKISLRVYILTVVVILITSISFVACNTAKAEKASTFKVYGNCGMCKKTIETALDQDGIYFADWNKDSKMIEVKFDSTIYNVEQIHLLISNAGYDTETTCAPDEAYVGLAECCHYERPM